MSLEAAPATPAHHGKLRPAGRLVERMRRVLWPAKHPRRADQVRWIESGGRRFGVVGPVSTRDPGLGQAVMWRKGNRPRIGRPFDREKVAPDFEIEVVLPWDEPGERGVVLEMSDAAGRPQCYRILLGDNSRVKPIDLGIAVPVGKVRVRPFFTAQTGEVRINFASQFEVIEGPPMIASGRGITLTKSDAYERARATYENNLECLDYESNWKLRQQEIDEGRALMTAAPRHIQMNIGHLCNIDCIMCNTGRTPDHTPLPEGVLRDLPNLLKFADHVTIQGGEPLMYKTLRDHISAAAGYPRVVVTLGTNGLLLRRGGWIDVITHGRFVVKVSLDAATPATYERIRRKSNWSEVIGAIDEVNEKRSGLWPRIVLSFCIMRSNYKEIVDFVDFAHSRRAVSIWYNLMEPGDLEIANKDENLHEDPETLREVVQALRDARVRANELRLGMNDKVLGWIFPRYPQLMTHLDDVKLVPANVAANEGGRIVEYAAVDEEFWRARSGRPAAKPLPAALPMLSNNLDLRGIKKLPPHRYPKHGFFCSVPFEQFNIDVENTFLCCHATPPFDRMTFGRVEGSFDVWNHPFMQVARREMVRDMAKDTVCHPRCPYYRTDGDRGAG